MEPSATDRTTKYTVGRSNLIAVATSARRVKMMDPGRISRMKPTAEHRLTRRSARLPESHRPLSKSGSRPLDTLFLLAFVSPMVAVGRLADIVGQGISCDGCPSYSEFTAVLHFGVVRLRVGPATPPQSGPMGTSGRPEPFFPDGIGYGKRGGAS
jgi:hypothetical protein